MTDKVAEQGIVVRAVGPARPLWCAAVCTLCIVVAARSAFSQTSANGSIRGYAKDPTGAVLQGAMITAASSAAPTSFATVTDNAGYYRLPDLPPGDYELTANAQRFATFVRPRIVVRAGLNLTVDIDMRLGGTSDTVTVTAESPMLESSSGVQAINVAGELQRQLPLSSRRDWADSLGLTPGVVATQNSIGKVFYYLHGSDFSSLVTQIDGADLASTLQNTTSYINLSTDAIQDVQIKTGAVDASTPIGAGAIVSVVTQSGTNHLTGAVGVAYQGGSWNGNNEPGGTSAAFEIVQPDASLGGPLRENRAWFFGAFRYTNNSLGLSRTSTQLANLRAFVPGFQPFTNDNIASYYFVKATAQLAPSHRIEGLWQSDHSPEDSLSGSYAEKFLARVRGGIGASVRLSSVWRNALTTRVSASYNDKGFEARLAHDDRPSRNVYQSAFMSSARLVGSGPLAILDNVTSVVDQPAQKLTLAADATWYRNSTAGSHELQAGVYLQPRLRERSSFHYVNGGYILEDVVLRDPSNPAAGFVPFHRQIQERAEVPFQWVDSHDYAVYIQDAWRPVPRLTINAGVRVDFVHRQDAAFDVTTQDSAEIGPRFGVNYRLTRDGRRAVRASWVRVADVLAQTTQSAGTNVSGFRDLYDTDLDGTFDTTLVTPGVSARSADRVLDDARHQPHTDEWIVAYQQQLRGQVSLDASLVRRDFRDRTALVEINGIYENGVFKGYKNESFNDIFEVTNNEWNRPVYTFFELQASKQTTRLQGIAGYTRQWRHLAGTWQPNDPASFIQPNAFPNSKGIGSVTSTFESQNSLSANASVSGLQVQNRDHVVRLGVNYRAPWDIMLATNYTFESALWSGPILARVAAPDPAFGPPTVTLSNGRVVSNPLATTIRFANATRDDGQFGVPAMHVWNVRIGRDIPLGAGRLQAALDLFNVSNHDAFYLVEVGAHQTFSPLYGQGRQRQTPRAAQLSARFRF